MTKQHQALLAQSLSGLLHPLLMPVYLAAVMLFMPAFAPMLPVKFRWLILGIVAYCFMLVPVLILFILTRMGKIKSIHLEERADRFLPLFLITISYIVGLRLMAAFHAPGTLVLLMRGVTMAILLVAIISVFWKISAHTTAIGGAFGITLLLSMMFNIDLTVEAIIMVLLGGILAWSRLYLNRHSISQVNYGFMLGFSAITISFLLHAWL